MDLYKALSKLLYFMGKETNRIGKRKRTVNIDILIHTTIEEYSALFCLQFHVWEWHPEKYHNGLCSVSLELVGGTLPLVYVVVPRRVHRRKLVIIGFQGQSKIRQLWCCLHDSAVKIFQYHSSRNDFPASFHSFIPVMANRHRVKRQNTKERLTFDASIDPGWCEPC